MRAPAPRFEAEPATEPWGCSNCGQVIRPLADVHFGHGLALLPRLPHTARCYGLDAITRKEGTAV